MDSRQVAPMGRVPWKARVGEHSGEEGSQMRATVLFLVLTLLAMVLWAQEPYKRPPQEVIDILEAPLTPRAVLSPQGNFLLLIEYQSMPPIAELAKPFLRLAGVRINAQTFSRQVTTFDTGMEVVRLADGARWCVQLPEGARVLGARWSYDDRWLAFARHTDRGVELWVAEAASGTARPVPGVLLNTVLGPGFRWLPDSRHLLATTVPPEVRSGAIAQPQPPDVPVGPNVQQTTGKFSKVRTYQDLLKNAHDEELFTFYATSQILEVEAETGQARPIGQPGIFVTVEPSPRGTYLLVQRLKRPFSYSVPYADFARAWEVWDRDGRLVQVLADLPVADEVPVGGVPTGPREISWRPLGEGRLLWVEALDGGDPEKEVPHRDRLMATRVPMAGPPQEVARLQHRFVGLQWLAKAGMALVTTHDWKRRWRTTFLVNLDARFAPMRTIVDISSQDRYRDPGRPVTFTTFAGEELVICERNHIYLAGSGASPRGDHPFLDRMNLHTLATTRLFQCAEGYYELFAGFVGASRSQIVTRRESPKEPPNYFVVDLKSGSRRALTAFTDPAPQLTGLEKRLLRYRRADGVELSGTLYLPPDYQQGQRLPLVMWAYPIEYSDPSTASQVRGSPNTFTFFRGASHLFFLTQGYAVLDGAEMPVVGDPKTMNDTFIEQIVASAKAAIDTLSALGIIDPQRVGVGGHSYGAFMTANLLAHSDLFAAGIARSGAYNRTLTPFGFQSERRTLWEAPESYFRLSPFMYAHKVDEPLLLIHGEADDNSGTFPIQSERFYHALKGHGATARLVLLPHEGHGYRARESVYHVLAEMFDWFDTHVKHRK